MTRKKKDIPLSILESLEVLVRENSAIIKIVDPKNALIRVVDVDPDSDFYFEVTDFKTNSDKISLQLDYKPTNKNNTSGYALSISLNNLSSHFKNWCDVVKDYDNIKTIYHDSILQSNEEYFNQKFDIVEEDADLSSFNLDQQIYLDDYLDSAAGKLIRLKDGRSEDESKELDQLVSEAWLIRKALPKETKRQVIKRLAKFWSRAQKMGLDVIKEIFIEVSAEIMKRLLIGP